MLVLHIPPPLKIIPGVSCGLPCYLLSQPNLGKKTPKTTTKKETLSPTFFFYNQIKSDRIPFSVSNRERMKRSQDRDEDLTAVDNPSVMNTNRKKKRKAEEEEEEHLKKGFCDLNGDLLFEVLKYLDARSLATATCVSKQWHRTAQDERLWELLCTRHCRNIGCGNQQLRSVVLALGGFRRLHSLYLRPLLKPTSSSSLTLLIPSHNSSSSSSSSTPPHWGKDEVNLSLSLLSIRYYEMMGFNNTGR